MNEGRILSNGFFALLDHENSQNQKRPRQERELMFTQIT
jgi:hypothetical protein